MATAAEAAAFSHASSELVNLATDDLRRLAPGVLASGATTQDVAEVYRQVIDVYSPAEASLAADFYDRQRFASGARGNFRTEVAGHGFPVEALERHAGRSLSTVGTLGVNAATDRLIRDLERVLKATGRNTGLHNAQRERVSWARVPSGPNPCAFCWMLASRGPVYSQETVTTRSDGQRYHYACNCVGHRIESSSDYPENFDPDEAYKIYSDIAKNLGSTGDPRHVAQAIRRERPDLVRDGVHED